MKRFRILFLLLLPLFLYGCLQEELPPNEEPETNNTVEEPETPGQINEEEPTKPETEPIDEDEEKPMNVQEVAQLLVHSLHEKDMATFAKYTHPEKGVRFSPYAYVQEDIDQLFSAEEMVDAMDNPTVYYWGVFDGKGNDIEKTFAQYYERFIYNAEFVNAEEVSIDERLGHGNSMDNSSDIYPNATVVEFYFSGFNPDYQGMDWCSLRIVLEQAEDGDWYVVGIIHDEWTI